jgi:aryl-alcohol dehydrogenase-like predicted oxidoreductase
MQSLILGTAQWGTDYGITNAAGRLADTAIDALVTEARHLGITILDTAPGYGDAEERIGQRAAGFRIQTKVSGKGATVPGLRASVDDSATRTASRIDCVLVHDWPTLTEAEQDLVSAFLEQCRADGVATRVGISGYADCDLAAALDRFDRLDVAQLPVSVLDQRLAGSPEVARLRAQGGRLQARSIYLQGLALAAHGSGGRAEHPAVEAVRRAATAADVTPALLCRAFIAQQSWVDEVVVGVTSAAELAEFGLPPRPVAGVAWPSLASDDPDLIDPRLWTAVERGG